MLSENLKDPVFCVWRRGRSTYPELEGGGKFSYFTILLDRTVGNVSPKIPEHQSPRILVSLDVYEALTVRQAPR